VMCGKAICLFADNKFPFVPGRHYTAGGKA